MAGPFSTGLDPIGQVQRGGPSAAERYARRRPAKTASGLGRRQKAGKRGYDMDRPRLYQDPCIRSVDNAPERCKAENEPAEDQALELR